jgi:hypothetical protein
MASCAAALEAREIVTDCRGRRSTNLFRHAIVVQKVECVCTTAFTSCSTMARDTERERGGGGGGLRFANTLPTSAQLTLPGERYRCHRGTSIRCCAATGANS